VRLTARYDNTNHTESKATGPKVARLRSGENELMSVSGKKDGKYEQEQHQGSEHRRRHRRRQSKAALYLVRRSVVPGLCLRLAHRAHAMP